MGRVDPCGGMGGVPVGSTDAVGEEAQSRAKDLSHPPFYKQ